VVYKCDSDVAAVVICQKSVIKTNCHFLVVARRVNPVRVFKISSPTCTAASQSMDWKGYVIAIVSLLCCQGRSKILYKI
jgi:hypothetical protein